MGPIYNILSHPITSDKLSKAYEMGMIAKKDLINKQGYKGTCRNACYAVWSDSRQKFLYVRNKFNHTFIESINHPEDDDGFDIFVPEEVTDYKLPDDLLNVYLGTANKVDL